MTLALKILAAGAAFAGGLVVTVFVLFCRATKRIPPMLGDAKARHEWIRNNCTNDTL